MFFEDFLLFSRVQLGGAFIHSFRPLVLCVGFQEVFDVDVMILKDIPDRVCFFWRLNILFLNSLLPPSWVHLFCGLRCFLAQKNIAACFQASASLQW